MSELTTEKVIGILADELCFETGGINEPHTNGCAQEAVAKAWLAQVQREAKTEELRDVAEYFERSIVPYGVEIGSWLLARAEQIEEVAGDCTTDTY